MNEIEILTLRLAHRGACSGSPGPASWHHGGPHKRFLAPNQKQILSLLGLPGKERNHHSPLFPKGNNTVCTLELTDRYLLPLMIPIKCSEGYVCGFIDEEVLFGRSRSGPAHLMNMVRCGSAFHLPLGCWAQPFGQVEGEKG